MPESELMKIADNAGMVVIRIKLLVCFFSALNVSCHSWYSVFST